VRAGPKKGDLIARKFVIEERLGEGATGVVVAARDPSSGKRVAIKIARTPDRESSSRFQRHARMMARLKGPHTVRVEDVGETPEGLPFMVMELLEGRSLGAVLASLGPLAPDDALRWMAEACDAIAEAHDLGIVHRDIRPENLFLQRKPNGEEIIRVLDFGLAPPIPRIDESEARLTKVGGIPGTSHYMAPEQVKGLRIDARTDVWGVGACLYRLLTGRFPFDGMTLAQVMKAIADDEPAGLRPGRTERGITPAVQAILRRCLAKVPRDRFPNLREVASALRAAREELPRIPSAAPSRPPAAARFETDRISAVPTAPTPELLAPRVPRIGLPSERSKVADATDEEPSGVGPPPTELVPTPRVDAAARGPMDTDPEAAGPTIREPPVGEPPPTTAVREWAETAIDPAEVDERLTRPELVPPTDRATIVEEVPAELVAASRPTMLGEAPPVSSRGTLPMIDQPWTASPEPAAPATAGAPVPPTMAVAATPPRPAAAPVPPTMAVATAPPTMAVATAPPTTAVAPAPPPMTSAPDGAPASTPAPASSSGAPSSFLASSDVIAAPPSSSGAPSSFAASSDVIAAPASSPVAAPQAGEPRPSPPSPFHYVKAAPLVDSSPKLESAGTPSGVASVPSDALPDRPAGLPKRRGVLVVGGGVIAVALLALVVWLAQRAPEKAASSSTPSSATASIASASAPPASSEPPASTVAKVAPFVPPEPTEASATPAPSASAPPDSPSTVAETSSPPPPPPPTAKPTPPPTRTTANTTPRPRPQPTPRPRNESSSGGSVLDKRK